MVDEIEIPEDMKLCSIGLDEYLFNRIEKHVLICRSLENSKKKKQQWIQEAIEEKLEREDHPKNIPIPRDKGVNFKLPSQTYQKLEKRLKLIKKVKGSFSRKRWIIEAIEEKLERESFKLEKFMEEQS